MKMLQRDTRIPTVAAILFALLFGFEQAEAQDLESTLKQFSTSEVKGYLQPFADIVGANINAGLFQSAEVSEAGFRIRFDVVGVGSRVNDNQKTYTTNAPPGFDPSSFQTATIFGGPRGSVPDGSYRGTADGIINTPIVPLAAPQLTIGDLLGTRAMIRFIAIPAESKLPPMRLWGVGVQHSISRYFSIIPIDVAAHAYISNFAIGDLIDFTGMSIGADASKSFSVLRLYGGLAWEKSTMNLKYAPANAAYSDVNIDMEGANNFRITFGLGLHLGPFSIFADADFGSITNFSGGIGFGG